MHDAEPDAQRIADLIAAPQREGALRDERNDCAGLRVARVADDLRPLHREATGELPGRRDLPRRLELEPGGTLLSGLHRARWIVRVRSRRIGPVQAVYGCGQQEVRAHLPLGADLMVGEPLRLQRAAGHVERAEL